MSCAAAKRSAQSSWILLCLRVSRMVSTATKLTARLTEQ
jgi:hypothetical protein